MNTSTPAVHSSLQFPLPTQISPSTSVLQPSPMSSNCVPKIPIIGSPSPLHTNSHFSVQSIEALMENHTKAINQLKDAITENRAVVSNMLKENHEATERLISDVDKHLEESVAAMKTALAKNVE